MLIDEAEDKMDAVTKELTNNNMRLKGLVYKVRSFGWWCPLCTSDVACW